MRMYKIWWSGSACPLCFKCRSSRSQEITRPVKTYNILLSSASLYTTIYNSSYDQIWDLFSVSNFDEQGLLSSQWKRGRCLFFIVHRVYIQWLTTFSLLIGWGPVETLTENKPCLPQSIQCKPSRKNQISDIVTSAAYFICTWWRHQMETFSALLVFCAGNSPVPGPRWIPRTKASDAEIWCFLWSAPE